MKRFVLLAVGIAAGILLGKKIQERDERARLWATATEQNPE